MKLENHPKVALAYNELRLSYEQLSGMTRQIAALIPADTKRVAIYSENRPEWIYALYGGWRSGAAVVPIDFLSTPDDVLYILEDCQPEIVFCSAANRPSLQEAVDGLSYVPQLICFDDLEPASPEAADPFEPAAEDVALLIYTSGTTGGPKGVVLTFRSLQANIEAVGPESGYYTPERRVMALLPFHHILPLLGTIVAPLSVGATIAVCPSLSPTDLVKTLQEHKIDLMVAVPRFYTMLHRGIMEKIHASGLASGLFRLAKRLDSKTFSRIIFGKVHRKFGGALEVMVSGGAPLGREVAEDFHTLGFSMMEGYGMTECAPLISFPRMGHVKCGAVGQAVSCNEIRIVDGEVIVRGGNLFSGYFNKPEATREALRDGWLYTGDLGYLDEDGFLFITGRKKELIILPNGKNISPDEVETKLFSIEPLLEEVAVFMNNDMLHALLYPVAGLRRLPAEELDEKLKNELIVPYNDRVAPYKRILKYTIIHEELPKTRLGKIKRFELKELLTNQARPEYSRPEPQTPEYREIKQFLEQQRTISVGPDDHLEFDLGLDSLDRVSLLAYLQQTFGMQVDEETMGQYSTVRKLAEFTRAMKSKFDTKTVDWAAIIKEHVPKIRLPRGSRLHLPVHFGFTTILKGLFKVSASGTEHIPQGACIFAPNHQSYFDGLFVSMFLEKTRIKRTFFFAKEKHVRNRISRGFADRFNILVVDIDNDVKGSIQTLAEVLRSGRSIIIFPEGTRSRTGELGEFRKTFAILSKELNVPVVPVAIDGAFEALPRGRYIPKVGQKIDVHFLEPVYPADADYDMLNDLVRNRIEQHCHAVKEVGG
ncbi:AMP-binding protein [Pontiellaceae bacterium B12227]|nr:AMP-binding protein [Pontiellaceae bacterium B12227]